MSKRIPYCVAPWMNSHVTADGMRSVCCGTTVTSQYETLGEWWQSPELRKLRIQMLEGKPPMDVCQTCINNTRDTSLAEVINRSSPETLELADENTSEEGFTSLMPNSFEVKHILCNLKCRHCFDRSSSTIRARTRVIGLHGIMAKEGLKPFGPIYEDDELTLKKTVNDIDWIDNNTKRMAWTGGEPFMSPLMLPYLQKLAHLGSFKVHQIVITNGMFKQNKKTSDIVELLTQFKSNTMMISCDGMGEIGAFSRSGWEESIFRENVKYLKEKLSFNSSFAVNFVLHAVSVLGMYDTLKFCLENNIHFKSQLINCYGPHHLDFDLTKLSVYEREFDRCRNLLASYGKPTELPIIETFYSVYKPRVINADDLAELEYSCKIRGQDGEYEVLTKGILNE